MNVTPSSHPSPPLGEKVPGGRLRGISTSSRPRFASKLVITVACIGLCSIAHAAETVLFSDAFDNDTSANWSLFDDSGNGTSDFTAQFAFDYGTTTYTANGVSSRIPPAPNSAGGTTRGLKLTVNKNDNTADIAAVSAYPKNQTFTGDYALRFDMWINYNGPRSGGTGSTEFGTFGINHTGTQANWDTTETSGDGIWFAVAGEGGATRDYRSYEFDGIGVIERRGLDAGLIGTDDGEAVFQERFPLSLYETPGAPGKRWVEVEVSQRNGNLVWKINGYVIAERANSAPFTSGSIMLGYMDNFASLADPKADNFILFDNVRVVKLDAEPATITVEATDADASEPGSDTGTFTITRTGDTGNAMPVNFRFGGSAESGADYQTNAPSLTIAAGSKSAALVLKPLNDSKAEGIETVVLTLAGGSDYELRSSVSATINLADDGDGTVIVNVSARRPAAYEAIPARVGQFNVTLSSAAPAATVVNYTLGGAAANGADYATLPNSVTIPSGETNAFITITPINNTKMDGNRNVTVNLASGAYVLGSATNGTVVIRDDDFPSGAVLFSDDFDKDTTAAWAENKAHPDDNLATFFYDYNADGIPPAPNSIGGSTRGLKLEANTGTGVFTGLSVSPLSQGFPDDYMLRFDMWINYNGPLNGGGTGSTLALTAGVGTAGATPQWPSATPDSVYFAVTGDGGAAADYRAYISAGAPVSPTNNVYAAGLQAAANNNTDPYYAEFGRESAPPAQLAVQPEQTGATGVGTAGMAWRDAVIIKQGTNVTWFIDGLRIASVNTSALNLSSNIFVGYFDINATQTANQAMSFGLVDNVRVLSLAVTTQPATITGLQVTGGNVQINFTGAASDSPSLFSLHSSAAVTGPYAADSTARIELITPGQFRASTQVIGTARFYQIKR
jgi:hypothetical protein